MASLARKLVPLADRVLIRRAVAKTQTAGGLYLPESATQKKEVEGEVLAVGPGARSKDGELVAMTVAVGDKVLLPEYGGHAVKVDDEELFLFRNDDIIARFED